MTSKRAIDLDRILAPIPGDNSAGENLRYTPVYDQINEARREDDPLNRGDWQQELKTADWDEVIKISLAALTEKTKDLQIAVWLTEGLLIKDGYYGFAAGLEVIIGLLENFWDNLYPEIEDDDLDFRAGPVEYLNEKLWIKIKQVPITDPRSAAPYSYLQYQESRQVGYETGIHNQYGDIDEKKKAARDALIAEGRPSAEDFDAAAGRSSADFYKEIAGDLSRCRAGFERLDKIIDDRFGKDAPRLAELRKALEDCDRVIVKILKEKGAEIPHEEQAPEIEDAKDVPPEKEAPVEPAPKAAAMNPAPGPPRQAASSPVPDAPDQEMDRWRQALELLKDRGIKEGLEYLFSAACSAPSVRERYRYRLYMAKLCLRAERPDLARPIAEELHAFIEELDLSKWESPSWIAEVFETLYRCLIAGEEPFDDDLDRARELLKRLCTIDVTKAITYKA